MNAIALQRTVSDMIAEFEQKDAALLDEIAAFNGAVRRLEMAANVGGQFGGNIWGHRGGTPSVYDRDLKKALLVSAWKAIYDRLQIDRLATADDKRLWERTIQDPPPLTMETAIATFGDYLIRSRFHILRGLAECFVKLDDAYKSHSKVKIGVSRLPKRIILTNMRGWSSYGYDRLRDVLNALATYRGQNVLDRIELDEVDKLCGAFGNRAGEATVRGCTVKVYQNGNGHLFFDAASLLDINRALAEFYGEVLPDAEDEDAKPQPGTAVAKDLQFYPTPASVIERVLYEAGLYSRDELAGRSRDEFKPARVLEPSCGDGRMLDAIAKRGHSGFGIEVHAGRAAEARAKGHAVLTGNFLDQPARPEFDFVIMNPPFYGTHWRKHVAHAMKFLAPEGTLAAILPASAHYDHEVTKEFRGRWHDLPVASFADSGTNIPTGYLIAWAPRA
jgi:hypothetical protein